MSGTPEAPTVNEPKKRTVKELLQQYRQLALPTSKRFRKRSRIARLEQEKSFFIQMMRRAAVLNAQANKIIVALIDESNFAVNEAGVIEWVADDTALNNARAYLKSFENPEGSTVPELQD